MNRWFLLFAAVAVLFSACEKGPEGDDNKVPEVAVVTTNDATDVSMFSMTLSANVQPVSGMSTPRAGIVYSTNPLPTAANGTELIAPKIPISGNISFTVSGLQMATTYYFRGYLKVDGEYTYGEVKQATTNALSLTIETADAKQIRLSSANLSATLVGELPEDIHPLFYYALAPCSREDLITSGSRAGTLFARNTKEASCSLSGLTPDTEYAYVLKVTIGEAVIYGDVKTFRTANYMAEAVDMGLSVKWSSMNLGAVSLDEAGFAYSWGEVETKESYTNGTYKWSDDNESTVKKYCQSNWGVHWSGEGAPDNILVLEPEDDAAHVHLGGNWHIPTAEQWQELMDPAKCTWQVFIGGYFVMSNITSNTIFLPYTGRRWSTMATETDKGMYWSSSLCPGTDYSPQYATAVEFDGSNHSMRYGTWRDYGLFIRPVTP